MQTRPLGPGGPQVTPLALGCAGMSDHTGPADEADAIATIRTALAAGVTLLDTADFYGMGHNEDLIRRALRDGGREQALLSVKFGGLRGPDGAFLGIEGRPAHVKNALAHSLRRLGTDHVDIYRPARLDPGTPVEDTIGAVAELVEAGYVRHIGLSEVGPETIRRAHAVHPICDVQIEYSLSAGAPSKTASWTPAASWGSVSPPTASSRTDCSAAPTDNPPVVTRAPLGCPASTPTTSPRTSPSSTGCGRSPAHAASASRNSPPPGSSPGTGSAASWWPSWAPGDRTASRRRWPQSTSS